VIAAAGNAAGWISGGAFNPAIGLGLDLSDFGSGFGWCLPYIVTQLIAGAVAALAFRFIRPSEFVEPGAEILYGRQLLSRCVAEFIGAFFIVMTVGLNVLKGVVQVDDNTNPINETAVFSISSCVMVMVYALGSCSGGHLNPAVTMAVYCAGRNKINLKEAGLYMASQSLGGICGALVYVFVSGGRSFALGPYEPFTWNGVVAAEFVFTWLLAYVVLCTATLREENSSHSKDIFGLAIGWCCTFSCVHSHTDLHTRIHTGIHTYIQAHIHTGRQIYIHTWPHI
jgi:glycerol uptake facilitator-like aquaporin